MFLPIRDAPNPPGVAVVNYALIAVNVAVFLLITVPLGLQELDPNDPAAAEFLRQRVELYGRQALQVPASAYDVVVHRYGYRPAEGSLLSILTSMFLHGGFMHLAGNMLFLWIYGDNVEARLGRARYLIAYLLSGAAATLFFSAFDSSSQIPLVGASGAISGVLGFYFVFFPRNVVHVAVLLFPLFMNVIQIRARVVLGFYLIVDNLLPVLASQSSNVAYGAHIGGFLAGFGGAYLMGGAGPDRVDAPVGGDGRSPTGSVFDKVRAPSRRPTAAERLRGHVRRGQHAAAAQAFFEADEEGIEVASADALELGRWLADNGHPQAALVLFRRVVAQEPTGETAAWGHLGAGYVQVQFLGRRTAAYQHFHEAIDCDPAGEAATRARRALDQMGGL